MSWYFFGGFSAYFRVPSGRWWNHSGCSFSQGWSALQLSAKSRAISIPTAFAASTRSSKEETSPRPGSIASWPPSSEPIAQGLPGSSGPATSELFGPLRLVTPIGWIGGR